MMHRGAMVLLIAVCGCGNDNGTSEQGGGELVWGEASAELSTDWCNVRERCFNLNEFDVCVRHNMHHLCELEQTCDVPVPEAEEAMMKCAASLEEIDDPSHPDCVLILYGSVTDACLELLDFMPYRE